MDEFTEILKKTGITEEHQDKPDARVDLEKKFESLIYAVKFLPVIIVAILLTVYFSEFNGEFGDQSTFARRCAQSNFNVPRHVAINYIHKNSN